MKGFKLLLFLVACGLVAGCGSTPKVTRIDVDQVVDLSGYWNDSDARLVAQEMIADVLARAWRDDFIKSSGRNPVVIMGHISNRTSEHINTMVFTKSLEKELLNSGKVSFVASPEERKQTRDEREDQKSGQTDPATMAAWGKEHGADYMLIGSLNAANDEVKGKKVMFYQVNLELVDLSTNVKVWIGQKEVKKTVERRKLSL